MIETMDSTVIKKLPRKNKKCPYSFQIENEKI